MWSQYAWPSFSDDLKVTVPTACPRPECGSGWYAEASSCCHPTAVSALIAAAVPPGKVQGGDHVSHPAGAVAGGPQPRGVPGRRHARPATLEDQPTEGWADALGKVSTAHAHGGRHVQEN